MRAALVASLVLLGALSGADALQILQTTAIIAAAVVAIATAAKLPIVSKPGRWLWRRLVAEPLAAWFHAVLDAWAERSVNPRLTWLEDQFRNNGGSTLRDRVDTIGDAVGADPPPCADES